MWDVGVGKRDGLVGWLGCDLGGVVGEEGEMVERDGGDGP